MPEVTYHCQNCGWSGTEDDLAPYSDMANRLEVGDTVPAGECPEEGCGAVCWSDEEMAKHRIEGAAVELLTALEGLLSDIEEYQSINHLGGENNHWQVAARAAIAKARGNPHA